MKSQLLNKIKHISYIGMIFSICIILGTLLFTYMPTKYMLISMILCGSIWIGCIILVKYFDIKNQNITIQSNNIDIKIYVFCIIKSYSWKIIILSLLSLIIFSIFYDNLIEIFFLPLISLIFISFIFYIISIIFLYLCKQ